MQDIAGWSMEYLCGDNLAYFYVGCSLGKQNSLAEIRVDSLSKNNLFLIAKGGHGIEVFNDELYLLGGEDTQGKL
jgi:hypothetical protein